MTEKKETMLHEVLAKESDSDKSAVKLMSEAINSFTNKQELFGGHERTLKMFDSGREHEEAGHADTKYLDYTVIGKLKFVENHLIKYYDVNATKECTNQHATATVTIDGKEILNNLPATLLLGLETKLKKYREVVNVAPTMKPGIEWIAAPDLGENIHKSKNPDRTFKTEKSLKVISKAAATKEHKEQVETLPVEKNVGEFAYTRFSGCLTVAHKSKLIERIDVLISAIKEARQRANATAIQKMEIGEKIFNFIHGE